MGVVKAGQTVILVPKKENVEIIADIISISPSRKLAQIEAIVCLEDFEVKERDGRG